jgi:hypothetical protein
MIPRAVAVCVLLFAVATVLGADSDPTASRLSRAQSLAWEKRFDEASAIYEDVLHDHPFSRDALLGLGRVRLWQGRYPEAHKLFEQILEKNAKDTDAAEGHATAAYWSGDYRSAEREFRAIVEAHPERATSRTSLDELHAASATIARAEMTVVDDDQPLRGTRAETRMSIFSDPLTRWDVSAGGYAIRSDVGGRHTAPFAMLSNETTVPALRLTSTVSLGAINTPDRRKHAIGRVAERVRLTSSDSVTVSFERRELLSNATRLYPFVDALSLRWNHDKPWLASAGIERDRFSDRNTALAADAYALLPLRRGKTWTLWAGGSGLYRDTRDSRFYVNGISATRDPTGSFFHYTYRGAYDPYWTPHDLHEARLIAAVEGTAGSRLKVRVQGDWGIARDEAISFYPALGPLPFPAEIGSVRFDRSYKPWRVRLTSSAPLGHGFTLDVTFEHAVTAFYRANTFHAALARRL